MIYAIGGFFALMNVLTQFLFNKLADGFYPRSSTEGNSFKTRLIFIAMYINTTVTLILAYNSFLFTQDQIKKYDFKDIIIGPFDEFNQRWYAQIGSALVFTILV
jgi:hypothetical protein